MLDFLLIAVLCATPIARQDAPSEPEAIAKLAKWIERNGDPSRTLDGPRMAELKLMVADVRMLHTLEETRRSEALTVLLDLAAFAARPVESARGRFRPAQTARQEASELGFEGLEGALRVDLIGASIWIATEVLGQPASQPPARRCAALELFRGRRQSETLLAIMSSALDKRRDVRDAAMAVLEGWDDDGVHRFMLQQLDKSREKRGWLSSLLALRHFERVHLAGESTAALALCDFVQQETTNDDWRRATRGVRAGTALDDALAIPALIEALSRWLERRELDLATPRGKNSTAPLRGSRRVEGDLERELRRRSGRNLGLHPDRWARWWRSRQSGTASTFEDPSAVTRAAFFGLRPWTDRVVFVIDRSGSMNGNFQGKDGSGANSRYDEALRQMDLLLRDLGPLTRFRIVLFESETHSWSSKLVFATEGNCREAQRWCTYDNHPEGGTALRAAIEQVLRFDEHGEPDLTRMEEDTVIVLCDGETQDGPSWVTPLLERINGDACIVFHCVQIGTAGDGTLQLLAELSGGDFVEVDG